MYVGGGVVYSAARCRRLGTIVGLEVGVGHGMVKVPEWSFQRCSGGMRLVKGDEVKRCSWCQCSKRCYGAAPTRVRPVESVREHAWRQSEREVSASLLIVFMLVLPLWMIIMSHSREDIRRNV